MNGKSAGKAQVKDYFAKIPCIYEPGELVGVGYDADGQEIYRTSVRTADAETMLTVKTDKNILRAGGQDFCFADVYVTDKNGTVKLLPDYDVKIEVVGAASLQGYGSAAYKMLSITTNTTIRAGRVIYRLSCAARKRPDL